jgi:hypothetical protein
MKFILKECLWWSVPVLMYICEIVLVCVNGPSIVTALGGWICCIFSTIIMAYETISRAYESHKKYEEAKRKLDEEIQKTLKKIQEEKKISQKIEKRD